MKRFALLIVLALFIFTPSADAGIFGRCGGGRCGLSRARAVLRVPRPFKNRSVRDGERSRCFFGDCK